MTPVKTAVPPEKTKVPSKTVAPIKTAAPAQKVTAPTVSEIDKAIQKTKTEEAPKGSIYQNMMVRLSKTTKESIRLKWTKVKGATGYIIYGNRCGKGNRYRKMKTIKGGAKVSATFHKLKKGKYYKFFVVAVKKDKNTQRGIAVSKAVHIAVQGGKAGNYKSVKLTNIRNNKLSLKKGKSFTLKAKSVVQNKKQKVEKHRKLCYESTNAKVATVNSNGKITGRGKGSCYIYVYDQTGNASRIKVMVK